MTKRIHKQSISQNLHVRNILINLIWHLWSRQKLIMPNIAIYIAYLQSILSDFTRLFQMS